MRIEAFKHTPYLDAAEWASKNMYIPGQGRYDFALTPFFLAPTLAACDVYNNCRVVILSPAQAGKSACITNLVCHAAVFRPQNTLLIMDTAKQARRFVINRLRPALKDCAGVKSLCSQRSAKGVAATCENITLRSGANLMIGGSKSATDLCSTPVGLLFLDELDRFERELEGEGDPITLAMKRQLRFRHSMCVMTSTPTVEDAPITQYYLSGTQEVWGFVCTCGYIHPCHYHDIDFTGDVPYVSCPKCGECWCEKDIIERPHQYAPPANENPFKDAHGRIARSFRFTSTLMHGIYTWEGIRREEAAALSMNDAAIRAFQNTVLAETYKPLTVEITTPHELLRFRLHYTLNDVPAEVEEVFCGIDTQATAFEAVIIGCDKARRFIYILDHKRILGDLTLAEAWTQLKAFVNGWRCITADGRKLAIALVCQDSGGGFTQDVYAMSLQSPFWKSIKGRSFRMMDMETRIIERVSTIHVKSAGILAGSIQLYHINTRFCKDAIYGKIAKILRDQDGGLYFSDAPELSQDAEFFAQLCSQVKTRKGGKELYIDKPGVRSECIDCTVYAIAAGEIYRLAAGRLPSAVVVQNDAENNQPLGVGMKAVDLVEVEAPTVKPVLSNTKQNTTATRPGIKRRLKPL